MNQKRRNKNDENDESIEDNELDLNDDESTENIRKKEKEADLLKSTSDED